MHFTDALYGNSNGNAQDIVKTDGHNGNSTSVVLMAGLHSQSKR